MEFHEMGLREELLRAIQEIDYKEPTPIQERAIPEALAGHDLMCCAQTGTGKTAAFALPILDRLAAARREKHLRALILVPTRELAMQVGKNLRDYGKYLDLVSTTAFGGVPIEPQEMMLRGGVDILVATPGRLKDHIWRGNIDFRHAEYLVLDEADRMLDMGFIKDVTEIVELIPTERQSMLFSATLEQDVQRLSKNILKDPVRIEVAPPATTIEDVDQYIVRTSRGHKASRLRELIRAHGMTRTIIFARTKVGASRLASTLRDRGLRASAIHSNRTQEERIRTLEQFREGRIDLLVATDIAARGLDIDHVSHVVNYDLPHSAKDYVHRIGRTGRAGRGGMALTLVTPDDMRTVHAIERLISRRLAWLGEGEPPPADESKSSDQSPRGAERVARANGGRGRRRRRRSGRGPRRDGMNGNGKVGGDDNHRRPEPVSRGRSEAEGRRQELGSGPRRRSAAADDRGPRRHSVEVDEWSPHRRSRPGGDSARRRSRKTAGNHRGGERASASRARSNGDGSEGVAQRIIGSLKRGLFGMSR